MANKKSWTTILRIGLLGGAIGLSPVLPSSLAQPTSPKTAPDQPTPEKSGATNLNLEIGRSADVQVFVVGAEKTQKLRFKPTVGSQQTLTMIWNWQTGMKVSDKPVLALQFPTIVATIETKVTQVDSNGDIHYDMNYRKVDVQPGEDSNPTSAKVVEMFKRQVQLLEGMQGSYVVTDQGKPKSASLTPPKAFNNSQKALLEQFSQSLANLSSPLPESAIGIGGKWQQKLPVLINGATIDQETDYELVELKNGQATIDITIRQTGKNQKISAPIKNSGDLQLDSLTSQGKGQMKLRLNQLLPIQSNLSIDSTMRAKVPNRKSNANATIETQNRIKVEMSSQ